MNALRRKAAGYFTSTSSMTLRASAFLPDCASAIAFFSSSWISTFGSTAGAEDLVSFISIGGLPRSAIFTSMRCGSKPALANSKFHWPGVMPLISHSPLSVVLVSRICASPVFPARTMTSSAGLPVSSRIFPLMLAGPLPCAAAAVATLSASRKSATVRNVMKKVMNGV